MHRCSKELVEEVQQHDCTHVTFEDLELIRERISDGKEFQQCAFNELQRQVSHKTDEHGIVVDTVEPQYTSQQCSKCGTTLEENRDGQHFECPDCSCKHTLTTIPSPETSDFRLPARRSLATAKNIARKLALKLQRGQKFR